MIMADFKESMAAKPESIAHHTGALVFLVDYRRDPRPDELGCDWVQDAQAERAAVLGAETATVLANYLRVLGLARGSIQRLQVILSYPGGWSKRAWHRWRAIISPIRGWVAVLDWLL